MLKQIMIEKLILLIFDLEKQIIIKTNFFNFVIEAILNQLSQNKKYQLIVFYLQKLLLIELNYKIYNKELLVIIDTFRK